MKFQRLEAFEKHCGESFPNHLSMIYVVICPKEQDRKKILSSLAQRFKSICELKKFTTVKEAIPHLNSTSLFYSKVAAIFDAEQQLSREELEQLIKYVVHPNPRAHLLLGAPSSKHLLELYKQGKQDIVLLDLSAEKPWERKERLKKWVMQKIEAAKKEITSDGVEAIFARLPLDHQLLEQELNKVLCFVGERSQITRGDIEAICSSALEISLFQIAEQLVWGTLREIPRQNNMSTLFPLVGQLRSLLEMGLQMSCFLEQGASHAKIAEHFSNVRPKTLEKYIQEARIKGMDFFKKGLKHLFELELGLKTSFGPPDILFACFCAKLKEPFA